MNAHTLVRPPEVNDPKLMVPIELLEGLPTGLSRDPKAEAKASSATGEKCKIYVGKRGGSDFVIQAEFDTLVVKRRRPNERAKTHRVTVGYAPHGSPWTIVETLCRRLNASEHHSIDIGDMVAEMSLFRETTTLVPKTRWARYLTPVQEAALWFLAERAEEDGLELLLTFPFQIWAGVEEGRAIWNGYRLPRPLDQLRPTMAVSENQNRFCFQPIVVAPKALSSSPIEAMKQLRSLEQQGDNCMGELERFADHLKSCSAAIP